MEKKNKTFISYGRVRFKTNLLALKNKERRKWNRLYIICTHQNSTSALQLGISVHSKVAAITCTAHALLPRTSNKCHSASTTRQWKVRPTGSNLQSIRGFVVAQGSALAPPMQIRSLACQIAHFATFSLWAK